MKRVRWPFVILVGFVVAALQASVFDQVTAPFGARIDLALLVVIGTALAVVAPINAARIGAVLGLIVDLTQTAPLGINLLLFGLAGYAVAVSRESLIAAGPLLVSFQGAVATVAVAGLQYMLARVFGLDPPEVGIAVFTPIAGAAIIGAIAVHPAVRVGDLMLADDPGRYR